MDAGKCLASHSFLCQLCRFERDIFQVLAAIKCLLSDLLYTGRYDYFSDLFILFKCIRCNLCDFISNMVYGNAVRYVYRAFDTLFGFRYATVNVFPSAQVTLY